MMMLNQQPSKLLTLFKRGFELQLFYAVRKTSINKSKLNLDMSDRGKSERSTGVFLFRFG